MPRKYFVARFDMPDLAVTFAFSREDALATFRADNPGVVVVGAWSEVEWKHRQAGLVEEG